VLSCLLHVLLEEILAQETSRLVHGYALETRLRLLELQIGVRARCPRRRRVQSRVHGAFFGFESLLGGKKGVDIDVDIFDFADTAPTLGQNLARFKLFLLVALELEVLEIRVLLVELMD